MGEVTNPAHLVGLAFYSLKVKPVQPAVKIVGAVVLIPFHLLSAETKTQLSAARIVATVCIGSAWVELSLRLVPSCLDLSLCIGTSFADTRLGFRILTFSLTRSLLGVTTFSVLVKSLSGVTTFSGLNGAKMSTPFSWACFKSFANLSSVASVASEA